LSDKSRRYIFLTMASKYGRVLLRRGFSSGMEGPSATAGEHGGMKTWRNMTLFLAVPGIMITFVNARMKEAEEHEHHERPEFIPYEFLYRRPRPFPWGDGNHTLFHNKHYNALPDGYED
ncbi:hypothetical protein LSH36_474g04000, partial [Paralvinella palmiformis]